MVLVLGRQVFSTFFFLSFSLGLSGKVSGLAVMCYRSTVLSQNHSKHLVSGEQYDPLLMSADLFNGTHTSSCGHCMHHECWQR